MFVARGGIGLVGILLLLGIMYFSGAATWLWERIQQLDDACYALIMETNASFASPACDAVTSGLNTLETLGVTTVEQVKNWLGLGSDGSFSDMRAALQERIAGLSGSTERLKALIEAGPQGLVMGNLQDQFQQAVDSFSIGQRFLEQGNMQQALPWLQQGAQQPQGLGLLSQLTLGDVYSSGGAGIPADPAVAQLYYQQAQHSLAALTQQPTSQSQQILGALPVSPDVLQQQLNQTVQALKAGKTK